MSKSFKFVINSEGVRDLLKSPKLTKMCMDKASSIAESANSMSFGGGYVAGERRYPERTGAAVYPSTDEAAIDNLQNNTLEKVRPW